MLGPSERVAAVLLAGGSGKRMGATDSKGKPMPKQFLELDGKSVLQLSIELLQRVEGLAKLVVVLAPEFRTLDFVAAAADADERIVFAPPGAERQNSVENGLAMVDDSCTLVAVHDAARPLVTLDEIHRCLDDAAEHGAAVLAVPMKATVKESQDGEFVKRTLDRKTLWEIHTPQVVRPEILREGFRQCNENNLEVTDDVSVVEQIGKPVKITLGEYTNLKLTTPEDIVIAKEILKSRAA
uniref:2-C-methyl-D-erythritol 4-phosphate cytidylyltransferase, chloroplastic n=2 Tax=Choreotrichia TaxID=141411 RepID=A0A7S3TVA7_9SPIT|mmetsp:Transcript_79433/g.109998  ORF Transcript_79433/g.109998 Transcript_79433/m.109998 type:complete len:240 (+) Transcript_79433:3-722(+)